MSLAMKRVKPSKNVKSNAKISDFFSKVVDEKKCAAQSNILCAKSSETSSTNESDMKRLHLTSPAGTSKSKKRKTDENSLNPSTSHKNLFKTPEKARLLEIDKSSPSLLRKLSPLKLFQKSPRKLQEFNVCVLEKFVKLSPSKSGKGNSPKKKLEVYFVEDHLSPSPSEIMSNRKGSSSVRIKDEPVEATTSNDSLKPELLDSQFITEFEAAFDDFSNEFFLGNQLDLSTPQHCKILEINKTSKRHVIKLVSVKHNHAGVCNIDGFWANLNLNAGDFVAVSAKRIQDLWEVNNENGYIVYQPNLLISCTAVVNSLFCKRRSVLSELYHGFEPVNRPMVIGTLVHTILQNTLRNKFISAEEIEAMVKNMLTTPSQVKKLYESGLKSSDVESELFQYIPKIINFMKEYVVCSEKITNKDNWKGQICEVHDIEENLWCSELGVKGKIDVTVRTSNGTKPIELKTGRATVSLEHRGQVLLYIMMMNKFGYKISSGLLLYLREGVLKEISSTPQEKRDIILLRNELAFYLVNSLVESDKGKQIQLPGPIDHLNACMKCPYNTICTSFLRYNNHDFSKHSDLKKVKEAATSHLTEDHLRYFIDWSTLINLEADSKLGAKSVQEIYTVPPEEREKKGRCIINLNVVHVDEECNGVYAHTFQKDCENSNFVTSGIAENNYVVVSADIRAAVASGFVTYIDSAKVVLTLDRNLNEKYKNKLFHLDTYDSSTFLTYNLTSLSLLLENSERAEQLRKIIIEKVPPAFAEKLPAVVAKRGAPILKKLNRVQQRAVLRALMAKDFLLITGMPGTGKTATVVALIELLVALNKSVIITSHTHSAIDNVCGRLKKAGVDFMRLGSENRINECLKSNSEYNLTKSCSTPEQLEEIYNSFKVVAVTCLGSRHPLLSKRTFDFCIVDESTQVLQAAVIRPIYAAKTFILIGDPNQLPPVVRNEEALKAGMNESLFERLQSPDATVILNLNYRMNKTITNLANDFTYEGQLQTANEKVANNTIEFPNLENVKIDYKQYSWLLKIFDDSLEGSVQFVDTGPVWKGQTSENNYLPETDSQTNKNKIEAAIVSIVVKSFIESGIQCADIGVIATYTAQVAQLSSDLINTGVDVSTVDQFQGRDKNVIIYSCTKSKDTNNAVFKKELLEDKRRLTVAITRAKCKLIIIGDSSTLQNYSTFKSIFKSLDKKYVVKIKESDLKLLC